jgi:hypothetical protein
MCIFCDNTTHAADILVLEPNLTIIDIRCDVIEHIDIFGYNNHSIIFDDCPNLKSIRVNSENLNITLFDECPNLNNIEDGDSGYLNTLIINPNSAPMLTEIKTFHNLKLLWLIMQNQNLTIQNQPNIERLLIESCSNIRNIFIPFCKVMRQVSFNDSNITEIYYLKKELPIMQRAMRKYLFRKRLRIIKTLGDILPLEIILMIIK